jgi:hypothetical protein
MSTVSVLHVQVHQFMKALPHLTHHLEISETLLLTTHIIHILSISALIHLDHMKLMVKVLAIGMYLNM